MNHYQDIDDGMEEFQETRERTQAENAFSKNPKLFSGDLGQEADGDPFVCTRVLTLHLQGGQRERRNHPYSYDSGFALLEGFLLSGRSVQVEARWSEGTPLDITIERLG